MIKSITTTAELRDVLHGTDAATPPLVILIFLTKWCASAVKVMKNVAELSAKFEADLTFYKVDCDEADAELTDGIEALPFFRFYRRGAVVGTLQGALPVALEKMIIEHKGALGAGKEQKEEDET